MAAVDEEGTVEWYEKRIKDSINGLVRAKLIWSIGETLFEHGKHCWDAEVLSATLDSLQALNPMPGDRTRPLLATVIEYLFLRLVQEGWISVVARTIDIDGETIMSEKVTAATGEGSELTFLCNERKDESALVLDFSVTNVAEPIDSY